MKFYHRKKPSKKNYRLDYLIDSRRPKIFITPDYGAGIEMNDAKLPTNLYEAMRLAADTAMKLMDLGMDPSEEMRKNIEPVESPDYMDAMDIFVNANNVKILQANKFVSKKEKALR